MFLSKLCGIKNISNCVVPTKLVSMDEQLAIESIFLIESSKDLIMSYWDSHDNLRSISPAVKPILGWDPIEVIGNHLNFPNTFLSQSSSVYYRQDRYGNSVCFEKICSGYTTLGVFFLLEKLVSKSLPVVRPSLNEFQDFFENGSIPLHMVGPDGIIRWANDAELRLLGYEREEYVGKNATLFHYDHNTFPEKFNKLNSGQHVSDFPARLKCKNGAIIHVLMDSSVARDEHGHFLYTRCFTRDITAARQLDEIKIAEKAASETLRFKSNFLAAVTHEIRTPLNGIIGMASLLLDTSPFTPLQKEYVDTIASSGEFLLALVNDILDLTKVDSGKMVIESIPFNVIRLMEDIRKISVSTAEQKGLNLVSTIDIGCGVNSSEKSNEFSNAMYVGDPFRLKQILLNYVSNAIKFTAHGTVSAALEIRKVENDEELDEITFSITDTGIGIADTSKLFEPFSQADSTISRRYGGTGLGLSICRKLAGLMGGRTGVRSKEGEGSTFWVTLPLRKYHEDESYANTSQGFYSADSSRPDSCSTNTSQKQLSLIRILLAEDNKVNQKVATKMLMKLGYTDVTVVEDGQSAVEAVRKLHEKQQQQQQRSGLEPGGGGGGGGGADSRLSSPQFDIILMDMQMPVMDGVDATKLIRALTGTAPETRIPVIALTANADSSNRKLCLESGMDDFMTKPMTLTALQEGMWKWTNGGRGSFQSEETVRLSYT